MKYNTPSVSNYNPFDFFAKFDRLVLLIFLQKNEKIKFLFKIYYMLNNIMVKINNNYDFLIR
jgi:hypothetical protein